MNLPYENATSGENALNDIRKVLSAFGCSRFGTMTDSEQGHLMVQFSYRGRDVTATASYRGYAAAWMKAHPHSHRMKHSRAQHEQRALKQAQISVCSVLRDWIKGQVVAVETGVLTFEGAFLGQILLPDGGSVLDHVQRAGTLPALEAPGR